MSMNKMSQPEKYLDRAKRFLYPARCGNIISWPLYEEQLAIIFHDFEVETRDKIADKVLTSPLTKMVLAGEIRKGIDSPNSEGR